MTRKKFVIATVAACLAGLLAGYVSHRRLPSSSETARSLHPQKPTKRGIRDGQNGNTPGSVHVPALHSTETLESMIAKGDSADYAGLALWLLDAGTQDIAAYWQACKDGDLPKDTKQLVILSWARKDPQAAITATAGTKQDYVAWWAWSAYDLQAAFAAANPDQLKHVVRGIGEFHPKWLKNHFEEIPEALRDEALNRLMLWKEDEDPEDSLNFLKKCGIPYSSSLFRNFALRDPWAALDWLKRNGQLSAGTNPLGEWIDAVKTKNPDDLQRFADQLPPGAAKRKIEEAIFDRLVATDPDSALQLAKSTGSPLAAAQRFAKIGEACLSSDPEKAFGFAADMLEACPTRLAEQRSIEIPNGSSSWSSSSESDARRFLKSLTAMDPERTLEMIKTSNPAASETLSYAARQWSETDLDSYTQWVTRQTSPDIKDMAALQLISQLSAQSRFHEAARWVVSSEASKSSLYSFIHQWSQSNAPEAMNWVESADLPANLKEGLKHFIPADP
ncbi:MAG: hypothetical protein QM680_10490 [Luteolibacter sp.]